MDSEQQQCRPEIADQFSIGYFRNFNDNAYEFSIETYYKNLQNQIDYKMAHNYISTTMSNRIAFWFWESLWH